MFDNKNKSIINFKIEIYNLNTDTNTNLMDFARILNKCVNDKINEVVKDHAKDNQYLYTFYGKIESSNGILDIPLNSK